MSSETGEAAGGVRRAAVACAPDEIDRALDYCITHAEAEGISLEEALRRLGPSSFCFVSLLLCVPFLQPISLGPLTIASGVTFMAAGWQMAQGKQIPLLPQKMRGTRIHGKGWTLLLRVCQRILRVARKFSRPRLSGWIEGAAGTRRVGLLIFVGGALLAIPVANLPFNNTFPALMILFATLAWLERDGVLVIASLFWGAITLVYFAAVAAGAWLFGSQIVAWVKALWSAL